MAPLPGVPEDIALIQGPLMLGFLFSYGLQGILTVQVYLYHINFPGDRTWIKALVWMIFLIECMGTAFATHASWYGLGAGWGDLEVLKKAIWSFAALPAICGYVALFVHSFFCWRIWTLGKNYTILILIMAVSLAQCSMGFYTAVKMGTMEDLREINVLRPSFIIWLGGSAVCDTMIAVSMVTFLYRTRKRLTFSQTYTALNKLMTLTVETGMITACASVLEVILLLVFHYNNLHFLICILLAKLYSNTMLATLNARVIIRSGSQVSTISTNGRRAAALWEDIEFSPTSSRGLSGIQITSSTLTDARNGIDKVWVDGNDGNESSIYDTKPRTSSTI